MERIDVYASLDSERGYQDLMTRRRERPDMVEIDIAGILLAMEEQLAQARYQWYRTSAPFTATMEHLRKVGGLAVKAGEIYGMPPRLFPVSVVLPDGTEETIFVKEVIPHGGHTDDQFQVVAEDGRIFRAGLVRRIGR